MNPPWGAKAPLTGMFCSSSNSDLAGGAEMITDIVVSVAIRNSCDLLFQLTTSMQRNRIEASFQRPGFGEFTFDTFAAQRANHAAQHAHAVAAYVGYHSPVVRLRALA